MNINPISANLTSFKCNDPACHNCCCQSQIMSRQPQTDVVDITTNPQKSKEFLNKVKEGFSKAKTTCKKGFEFAKNNKSAIGAGAKAVGLGLVTGFAVIGANQTISKVFKANTSAMANKVAIIAGLGVGLTSAIENRKAFQKTSQAEVKQ